jgi:anti-sigma factor RsiW
LFNSCGKYRRVKLLAEDGRASRRQSSFLERHEATCDQCRQEHALTMSALSALRASVIEPEPDPGFESRFIRRWRVESRARAVSYWMPAIAGAIVASVALLAVLQILFAAPTVVPVDTKGREALLPRTEQPEIPNFGESLTDIAPSQ